MTVFLSASWQLKRTRDLPLLPFVLCAAYGVESGVALASCWTLGRVDAERLTHNEVDEGTKLRLTTSGRQHAREGRRERG